MGEFIFIFQRLHQATTVTYPMLEFSEIIAFLALLHTDWYHPQTELDLPQLFGEYNLCISCKLWGIGLWHPCFYIS
jgi:hypothetical protein